MSTLKDKILAELDVDRAMSHIYGLRRILQDEFQEQDRIALLQSILLKK